ncbi:MAG: hypothetical protein ACLUGQ_08615 [Coprococcus sp.]
MQDSCTNYRTATGLEHCAELSIQQVKQYRQESLSEACTTITKTKPVTPGVNVIPSQNPGTVPTRPFPGIQRPSELRSNVEEKSLDIPSFLKKGTTQHSERVPNGRVFCR